jgi:hypothetical protein
MALSLTLGGVDRTSWLFLPDTGGSINYDLSTRAVGSLRVRIYDKAMGVTVPSMGTVGTLTDSTTGLAITGALIDIAQTGLTDQDGGQLLDLVFEDRNALPAQALISGTWAAGSTLGDILNSIILASLYEYGTVLHPAQAVGPSITSDYTVEDAYVDEVLNQLQTLTGWIWRIDASNQLRMIPPAATSSGLVLDDASAAVIGKVKRHNSRAQGYANRIRYRYGSGKRTELSTHTATGAVEGDDIESYVTTYPASTDINDPWPNRVFIGPTDTYVVMWSETTDGGGYLGAWWNPTTRTIYIRQSLLGVTPAATDVKFGYTAQFPDTVAVEDAALIATDGHPVARLVTNANVTDIAAATDAANAELRRRKALGATAVTVSHRAGMAYPGETVSLSFAQHAIAGTFMVTTVQVTDDEDGELLFTMDLIGGSEQPETWLDAFTDSGGGGGGGGSTSSSGGTVSITMLATPFVLGGHDIGSMSAANWTRVQSSQRFTATSTFSAIVAGEAWARDATVAVTVRLFNVTDNTTVAGTSSATPTTTRHNPVSFTANLVVGNTYELQIKATTVPVGKSDQVYANGWQLKAA